jgi:hypothetical protein
MGVCRIYDPSLFEGLRPGRKARRCSKIGDRRRTDVRLEKGGLRQQRAARFAQKSIA